MQIKSLAWVPIACGIAVAPALAQDPVVEASPSTAVYLELGGPTEYASLNVDRRIAEVWAVRAGFLVAGSGGSIGQHYVQFPVSASRLLFFGRHGIEAGGGVVTTLNSQYPEWQDFEYFLALGYRTLPLENGMFLRAEVLTMPSREWWNWFGVGVGYAF